MYFSIGAGVKAAGIVRLPFPMHVASSTACPACRVDTITHHLGREVTPDTITLLCIGIPASKDAASGGFRNDRIRNDRIRNDGVGFTRWAHKQTVLVHLSDSARSGSVLAESLTRSGIRTSNAVAFTVNNVELAKDAVSSRLALRVFATVTLNAPVVGTTAVVIARTVRWRRRKRERGERTTVELTSRLMPCPGNGTSSSCIMTVAISGGIIGRSTDTLFAIPIAKNAVR
jgi:hypothetical protein